MTEDEKSRGGADKTAKKQTQEEVLKAHQFQPGKSPNPAGRPKGSRNKLGEAFLSALHEDFEKNGASAIEKARKKSPLGYIKVCASILPKDLNINFNPLEELTDAELVSRLGQLETAVASALGVDGESSGAGGSVSADKDESATPVPSVH